MKLRNYITKMIVPLFIIALSIPIIRNTGIISMNPLYINLSMEDKAMVITEDHYMDFIVPMVDKSNLIETNNKFIEKNAIDLSILNDKKDNYKYRIDIKNTIQKDGRNYIDTKGDFNYYNLYHILQTSENLNSSLIFLEANNLEIVKMPLNKKINLVSSKETKPFEEKINNSTYSLTKEKFNYKDYYIIKMELPINNFHCEYLVDNESHVIYKELNNTYKTYKFDDLNKVYSVISSQFLEKVGK